MVKNKMNSIFISYVFKIVHGNKKIESLNYIWRMYTNYQANQQAKILGQPTESRLT